MTRNVIYPSKNSVNKLCFYNCVLLFLDFCERCFVQKRESKRKRDLINHNLFKTNSIPHHLLFINTLFQHLMIFWREWIVNKWSKQCQLKSIESMSSIILHHDWWESFHFNESSTIKSIDEKQYDNKWNTITNTVYHDW